MRNVLPIIGPVFVDLTITDLRLMDPALSRDLRQDPKMNPSKTKFRPLIPGRHVRYE